MKRRPSQIYTAVGLSIIVPYLVLMWILPHFNWYPPDSVMKPLVLVFWIGVAIALVGQWKSDTDKKRS